MTNARMLCLATAAALTLQACTGAATPSPGTPSPDSAGTPVTSPGTPSPNSTGTPATTSVAPTASQDDDAPLTPVTFMAGFSPQANLPFVAVYAAADQGFFEEEGLEVEIQHTAGGGEHLQLLATGTVDVTTQDAAVLLERRVDPGLPLVSLALLGQTGQQAYIALEKSGIETPADWTGHTVGFRGTPPPDLYAILDAVGLTEDDIELVNVGFDPRVLIQGQVDVLPVYKSNEPNIIRGFGEEVVLWEAADYGAPTLGLTWVATDQMVAEHPDVLDAFVDAAMRGVEWTDQHRDDAVALVVQQAGEGTDPAHQRYMLDTELDAAHSDVTDQYGLGWQTETQFRELADLLLDTNVLTEDLDVTDVFTTEFLE